ncbi:hypothetical protein [Pseudactinotalea sp. Z1748]|uniref:hypothetical protein n=1 Tax=Pseudactinotalea sp. Z1748 TaxID=3413027 RepID=UPI003C7E0261
MRSVTTPAGTGFNPVHRTLPPGVGTNGQVCTWGAQLAGAAPPEWWTLSRG